MIKKGIVKYKKILTIIILLCSIGVILILSQKNEVEATSRYGSRGEEVKQIQTKLKRWRYDTGSVDCIYGNQTVTAVKR